MPSVICLDNVSSDFKDCIVLVGSFLSLLHSGSHVGTQVLLCWMDTSLLRTMFRVVSVCHCLGKNSGGLGSAPPHPVPVSRSSGCSFSFSLYFTVFSLNSVCSRGQMMREERETQHGCPPMEVLSHWRIFLTSLSKFKFGVRGKCQQYFVQPLSTCWTVVSVLLGFPPLWLSGHLCTASSPGFVWATLRTEGKHVMGHYLTCVLYPCTMDPVLTPGMTF